MASLDSGEAVWNRVARYMQLASHYEEKASRETDPATRAGLFQTVVHFLTMSDAATDAEPALPDEKAERLFVVGRPQKQARPQLVRNSAPQFISITKTNLTGATVLKTCRTSGLAPHPARGLLPAPRQNQFLAAAR